MTEQTAEQQITLLMKSYTEAHDAIILQIESVYAKYLKSVDPQDYYNIMIQYDRLTKLLKQVDALYYEAAKASKKMTPLISSTAMVNSYYRKEFLIDWLSTPVKMNFAYLDPRLVNLTVTGTAESWKKISDSIKAQYPNIDDFPPNYGTLQTVINNNVEADLIAIQNTITQGFLQGQKLTTLTSAIQGVMNNAAFKAERIARTEYTRTANAGAYAQTVDAANAGIDVKIQWVATLDMRTRRAHAALDGKQIDPTKDEYFYIGDDKAKHPGDFRKAGNNANCRCSTIEIVEGQGLELRRGRNPSTGKNEVFTFKDFDTWANDNGLKYNSAGALVKK